MPQGTVLGPLMFLTYINDITNGINGQMRLFADDALLYYPVRTIADGASLQHDLHTLHRWSKSWKMAFNGKKCHVMHVTRNRNIANCSYTLGQDKLTPVSHPPYLGVELDDHLNWKEQTARVRSKGVRMLNMVRRNFTCGTTPTIRCEIYKSLVRPSMEYGSIVWDPHQLTRIKTLEAVQNIGARYVNQDWDRHTSVTTMKKDLGWLTLQERRLVNRLTFLMKSIHNIHGHTLPPHVVKPARALRTRHTESYANLRARTDAYKFSFLPRSIRAWNSLHPEIIAIQNPDSYRNAIATALRKGTIEMTNNTASSNNYKARTDIPIPLF